MPNDHVLNQSQVAGVPIITNSYPIQWMHRKPFLNSASSLPSASPAVWLDSLPSSDIVRTAIAGQWLIQAMPSMATLRKIFGVIGHPTGAANQTCAVRVYSFKPMEVIEASGNGDRKLVKWARRCLLDLTLEAGSNQVPLENGFLDASGTGLTDLRWVSDITVNADYTLKASATGRQTYFVTGAGAVEQAFDGDSAPFLGYAMRPAGDCGVWLGMSDLNAL